MSDNDRVKSLTEMGAETIQERGRTDEEAHAHFLPLLSYMVRAGELIAPWWSKRRDRDLDMFWKKSDHVSGAFYTLAMKLSSVPFRILPRDNAVAAHRRLADEYQENLEVYSEFGQGWDRLVVPSLIDLWTQDNGLFFEVIGGGDKGGPLDGLALGLAHLDSYRCQRTGSAEYPVIYEDTDGMRYRLHRTRVIFTSQMPSPRAEMFGVGFCWLSRAINTAQTLIDILQYKQEKMGSRPKRSIAITRGGLDPDDVASAFQQADFMMDAQGLTRFSKMVLIGDATLPDADLSMVDLASLPDGFDEETSVTLGMFAIALTGAVPPRWLWPATTTGATKADAMYQHVAGLTGGPGATLAMLARMIGGSDRGKGLMPGVPTFLPPQLYMEFDFQDDEQDRTAAEIHKTRAEARERDLNAGVITVRIARQQMLDSGELSEDEFELMELEDGRLPDGKDVLNLFYQDDADMQALLDIGVEDPLNVLANDPAQALAGIEEAMLTARDVLVNASLKNEMQRATYALAALEELKATYLEQVMQGQQQEEEEAEGEAETEAEGETEEEEERGQGV